MQNGKFGKVVGQVFSLLVNNRDSIAGIAFICDTVGAWSEPSYTAEYPSKGSHPGLVIRYAEDTVFLEQLQRANTTEELVALYKKYQQMEDVADDYLHRIIHKLLWLASKGVATPVT